MTLTKEQKEFLETLRKSLGNVTMALREQGIKRDTYNDWLDNPFFEMEVEEINQSSLDYVENVLMSLIKEGNIGAIQYYLKHKGKDRGYG